MSGEADERLPAGPRGPRGERGLSRLQGRAVVVLFLIGALGAAGNLFWTGHEVRAAAAAQQREQDAQQRQGAAIVQKLCTSLARQAALVPPGGSTAGNPSRVYLQQLHAVLAELGPDVGCKGKS